jgi:hypothetical protein
LTLPEPDIPSFDPIPFRVRIGVTGHRTLPSDINFANDVRHAIDLIIRPMVEAAAGELENLGERRQPPILYSVVSPLAEGADRLVAREVLRRKGARLKAVLPLTQADYLKTFENKQARDEFLRLLEYCPHPVCLRDRDLSQDSADENRQRELRQDAYDKVGRYVVDHCDVLIALWDGETSRGKGGTYEVVQYALTEKRPVVRVWDGAAKILDNDEGDRPAIDVKSMDGISRFNSLVPEDEDGPRLRRRFEKSFFGEKGQLGAELGEASQAEFSSWLLPFYARASLMAEEEKSFFMRLGNLLYALSALAVGCVAVGVLLDSKWGYALELIVLLVIWSGLIWTEEDAPRAVWIETRFLAERIRCAGFLAMAGLEAAPAETLPFMAHAHGRDDWMVRVFDEIMCRRPDLKNMPNPVGLKGGIQTLWLERQIEHHRDRASAGRGARRRLEVIQKALLGATIIAAAIHLTIPGNNQKSPFELTLTTVAILFPAIAASTVGIQVQREYGRLAKRSESFGLAVERLKRRMANADTDDRFRAILREADELFLRESQDWLMLMRHVEIKVG